MAEELINRKFDLNDKAEAVETPKSEPEAAPAPVAAVEPKAAEPIYMKVISWVLWIFNHKLLTAAVLFVMFVLGAGMFSSVQDYAHETEKFANKSVVGRIFSKPPVMQTPLSVSTRGLLK